MPRQTRFRLIFAPETVEHLDAIELKYHRLIAKTIDEQLTFAPESQARNRKPLEQAAPYEATWELRFGPGNRFRVFYEVDSAEQTVWVLAIGVKTGDRLFIGGEEFEL
jgi:mRNA-degrading endonuclease RelE of RelBE toxin-antitoxin system